jgi:hypothetical protein
MKKTNDIETVKKKITKFKYKSQCETKLIKVLIEVGGGG